MRLEEGLTFDDVLIVPEYSEIKSRADVDLSVELCKGFKFQTPVIPANMKTIFEEKMARKVYDFKGLGFIHRFMTLENKLDLLTTLQKDIPDIFNYIGMSVGIQDSDKEEVKRFTDLGVKIICIDVAHLHNKYALEMVSFISKNYPDILLVAGTIATAMAAAYAWNAGADIVRVNLGNGSICSTRLETGVGVPQLTAIQEIHNEKQYFNRCGKEVFFISDGGCSKPGDFCKALCVADMVMSGNTFAGTDETPGSVIEQNGAFFKRYDGSSTYKTTRVEGFKAMVPYKGPVENVFNRIHEGIQSSCSYRGAKNLTEFKKNVKFIRITNAGLKESHAHDITVI